MTNLIKVNFDGITLEVEFDYQPYEPQEEYYPGCDEEYEITAVYLANCDILDLLSDAVFEKIIKAIKLKEECQNNECLWKNFN